MTDQPVPTVPAATPENVPDFNISNNTVSHRKSDLGIRPYAGSSGHSGSEASEERATYADTHGITGKRQRAVLYELAHRGTRGMTWREFASAYGLHHGQATGPLSVLHKEGHIVRLAEKRARCHIYVMPLWVNGRETSAHRPQAGSAQREAEIKDLIEINRDLSFEIEGLVEVIRELMGNSGYCPKHAETEAGCAECRAQMLLSNR